MSATGAWLVSSAPTTGRLRQVPEEQTSNFGDEQHREADREREGPAAVPQRNQKVAGRRPRRTLEVGAVGGLADAMRITVVASSAVAGAAVTHASVTR